MITRAVVILTAVSFAWTAAAQQKFQKLAGAQIRAKFSGMELTDQVHWYDFYERNGTLVSSSMGHKRTGKWWTEKDQLCLDDSESVRFYEVQVPGDNVQLLAEGFYPVNAVLRVPISRR
jgi:hypothetical protein